MKLSFRKSVKIFKYLTILFIPIYWIYILFDDYIFIKKYWTENWLEYLGIWTMYFIAYFLIFSIYYWLITSVVILVYHKIYLRIEKSKKISFKNHKSTMTKNSILLFLFCLTLSACGQIKNSDTLNGFTIDPKIKNEAEKNIAKLELGEAKSDILIYNNIMQVDLFEDDKLKFSTKGEERKQVFKSFYYWQGDTLGIDGAFGFFGSTGFSIKLFKGKASLFHMLSSDEFPTYAYKEKDSLIFRLEVPCKETKIILSEIPDSTKKQIIYGYAEFKSDEYFASSGSAEDKEILPRKKLRVNMKVYFKSSKLEL